MCQYDPKTTGLFEKLARVDAGHISEDYINNTEGSEFITDAKKTLEARLGSESRN